MQWLETVQFQETPGLEGVTFQPKDETGRLTLEAAAQSGVLGRCVQAFMGAISASAPLDLGFAQTPKGPVLYDLGSGSSYNLLHSCR